MSNVNIKAKLRTSTIKGKDGRVFYQIVHNKVTRYIKTDYSLHLYEWHSKKGLALVDYGDTKRVKYLKLVNDKIGLDIRRLYSIAQSLENKGRMNHCDDLVVEYYKLPQAQTFFAFFETQISRIKEHNRSGTAYNYLAAFNSFYKFREGEDLTIDSIDCELIEDYEAFLKSEKVSMNSSSFYMRILRAVYNRAVDKGLIEQQFPFKRVYTGVEKTVKRALPVKEIKRIKNLDLSDNPLCEYARDMFLLSFYTRGMSFVDMAHLRKDDLRRGVLSYRRRKTGQLLHIKWERCMQEIVRRYRMDDSTYLLPIVKDAQSGTTSQYYKYKGELCKVNNQLKKIAQEIGLAIPLTMYVARHSWASAARTKNIPLSIISESMGHDSEATTQIYLASLDSAAIDKANSLILKAL